MKFLKIEIPKAKLLSIPKNERIFLVQIGNLMNDLNVLQKALAFTMNVDTSDRTIRAAQGGQASLLMRIQAGKLWEGWQMLQKDFFSSKLSAEYGSQLEPNSKQNLVDLKKYFSKDNKIKDIRNNYAFHYSSDEYEKLIDKAPKEEVFELFVSDNAGNTLYQLSNVLINFAMLDCKKADEIVDKIKGLYEEILQVTKSFVGLIAGCSLVIAKKYLGLESVEVSIPEPCGLNDVQFPYFVKP